LFLGFSVEMLPAAVVPFASELKINYAPLALAIFRRAYGGSF
jgi:hypothetical protein